MIPAVSQLPHRDLSAGASPGDQERVDYRITLGCTVGLVGSYLLVGALGEGGAVMFPIALVLLAGAAAFSRLNGRVNARWLARGALAGVFATAAVANVLFPVGGITLIFSVNVAQLVFWEVASGRVAAILIALLFLMPAVAYALGFGGGYGAGAAVAEYDYLVVGVGALWSVIYATLTMRHARRAYAGAHARLTVTEARIARELASLRSQTSEQAVANDRLEREAAALEARLQEERSATGRLREALGDREQLAAAIRSDLREPLRSITSFSQLLQRRLTRDFPDGRVGDYLAFAVDGGRRMATMVDDLLRYTHSDHGEALRPVALAASLEEARLNLAAQIERSGARLTAGELPLVRGYPTQLLQLFQNIISNAIKFARPGVPPVIEITAAARGRDAVRVTIADNGRGIPAAQIGEVFGLFNRSGNVGEAEGSGVGLALCRRIAIAHGGDLSVASVLDEGTAFYFDCPLAEGTSRAQIEGANANAADVGGAAPVTTAAAATSAAARIPSPVPT